MGRDLKLENLTKRYGQLTAVNHVDLEIREGEFICFLGPSGCGKTTVLRMITGFETVTEGNVIFDNRVINDIIPKNREFGIVFQSYALFPNMTVEENIAFGLKMRKMPKKAIAERVNVMLDLVGLSGWRSLYPAQLSGGQQQRVALVRALAPDPQVLLLDEPLSALDAKIRLRLRAEIKRLQQELKKTMIHVTHDQEEALSIADRVVVMEGGKFRQVGRPIDIYKNPSCSFVADFVGTSNFFDGRRTSDVVDTGRRKIKVMQNGAAAGEAVSLSIRPENVEVYKEKPDPPVAEPMNLFAGRIDVVVFQGAAVRLLIHMDGEEVISDIIEKEFRQRELKQGDKVYVYCPPESFMVFPEEGGRR
ncbi:MAG TPA: ATP-binding cassette domain-containing protein [Desulfobacterales bacterium]|jgi:ABC-type Fe3+/spermidine/putrescine transport system ATPase subunit|nr:ATP-binding cassette domain-containing protein [Desulfobacterales bacterium]